MDEILTGGRGRVGVRSLEEGVRSLGNLDRLQAWTDVRGEGSDGSKRYRKLWTSFLNGPLALSNEKFMLMLETLICLFTQGSPLPYVAKNNVPILGKNAVNHLH